MTDLLDVRIEASAFALRPLRHELSTALRAHSIGVPEGDVVVSLVNELATVAIIAGTGPLNVRVSLDHATITAAVTELTDRSDAEFVASRHAGSFRIVAGLADSWGYACESEVLRLWASSRIDALRD
jgi:hypothetical protein